MRSLRFLMEIDRESWGTASKWLGYTLIIGLVPIWSGIIVASICAPNAVLMFVDRAQLAFYSTALLAAGFYIIVREFKNVHLPGRAWFLLIMVVLLIVAIAVSSVVTIENLLMIISGSINYLVLRCLSIVGFTLSAGIVFILQALNRSQEDLDARAEQVKQQDELAEDYRQLEGRASKLERLLNEYRRAEEGNDERE